MTEEEKPDDAVFYTEDWNGRTADVFQGDSMDRRVDREAQYTAALKFTESMRQLLLGCVDNVDSMLNDFLRTTVGTETVELTDKGEDLIAGLGPHVATSSEVQASREPCVSVIGATRYTLDKLVKHLPMADIEQVACAGDCGGGFSCSREAGHDQICAAHIGEPGTNSVVAIAGALSEIIRLLMKLDTNRVIPNRSCS